MHDPFFKKNIQFEFKKHELTFHVSQDLFSSEHIDKGTQRLLRTFIPIDIRKYKKILDVGCGYGPIGISLKVESPESEVHMIDSDALALFYTKQNAELNNVTVNSYASLGYDNGVDTDFDLIVSNIPAKVGKKALASLLLDSQFHIKSKGTIAIVVVDAILEDVREILHSDSNIEINLEKSWPGHTVFHYYFNQSTPPKREEGSFLTCVYDRTKNRFRFNQKEFIFETTYNLSEFDTLRYETQLLLEHLHFLKNKPLDEILVFHPNQGHVAVVAAHLACSRQITLIDRNLQSLETSKRNLMINGVSSDTITLSHQVGMKLDADKKMDAIIGVLPEKENKEVYETTLDQSVKNIKSTG